MEFIEFAHPNPAELEVLFRRMGFRPAAAHRSKQVTLWRHGDINFVVNAEPASFAQQFAGAHGPCICAMAFRVVDANNALKRALALGAEPFSGHIGPMELSIPAIRGIGGSLIYFVDRYGERGSIWEVDFHRSAMADLRRKDFQLHYIDHLTHNVRRGRMDYWADWYRKLFNFKDIRFFNIEGKLTGLISRAITSPCGKIRIPINESLDDKSQIEEYLREYKGEGIQHVALGSNDIYASVEALREAGLKFMPPPPASYYEKVGTRVPEHGEPINRLRQNGILIDGEGVVNGGATKILLQIFSSTVLGPIFFEFIQRKGDEGFGEGNFRALFESIEEDQVRRGVLHA
jgi:4-hydroxyphenylpyruvate dioxygenase